MPELPEVETVARQLRPYLKGRLIRSWRIMDPRLALTAKHRSKVKGCRIGRVRREGKQILLEMNSLQKKSIFLLIHLRMTGRLIYSATPLMPGTKHIRAIFELDRGWLFFQDTRRFGTIKLMESEKELRGSAVDPFSRHFTPLRLKQLFGNTTTSIKTWLLRQDKLAGMGNIYASESLFVAGINPTRVGGSLRDHEVSRLHGAIQQVLRRAIKEGGTTFSDFRDGNGRAGNYARKLQVYDRAGEPCRKCGRPIERLVQAQRSTFYCPNCQH
jgi:formamidopyrimidine-DNA glycosylase